MSGVSNDRNRTCSKCGRIESETNMWQIIVAEAHASFK